MKTHLLYALTFLFELITASVQPQVVLGAPDGSITRHTTRSGRTDVTSNLIFWSVNSFLQQWPHTRYMNGHTITAASVPPGTLLYHGRYDSDVPDRLDWVATDADHSIPFCRGKCWLSTFVTTRTMRLVYFDGFSGAKIPWGTMDSQDIFLWGKIQPEMTREELVRIKEACDWAKGFGIDGFVRGHIGIEIMICDFANGINLVSHSQLVPWDLGLLEKGHITTSILASNMSPGFIPPVEDPPDHPVIPKGWRGSISSTMTTIFELFNSALRYNHAPDDTRVKIDYSRVVTFFDPVLTSLVAARANTIRDFYRLEKISVEDVKNFQDQIMDIFTRKGHGSGIDWGSITQVIIDRYGGRLELLRHILENPDSKRNITEQIVEARSQILTMLTPYMLTSAIPQESTGPVDPSWITPVVEHCASTHTTWAPQDLLTKQEKAIKVAIEGVLNEICSTLGELWLDAFDAETADIETGHRFVSAWRKEIVELMDWLDWPIWLKCNPACGNEEVCYITMWPCHRVDATPRCVEAVAPYRGFRCEM
ncbi:hypothetical protein BDM02DRAFT_3136802 [Thelephora ganbajun]|uniref:Uncharacterized protein n=1 Tax=Thelephora ganbajun TaxID=370292 RepID=A0ACB6ZTE5_THEGA|nr:hypothetical protein BDM02DRAFT_3136802 [Thelephora ganbajun]